MSGDERFQFHLYIAGEAQNSSQAVANLDAICREHLAGRYDIEIVDVLRQPDRALADGILMTPTLVKSGPAPGRRIIGTLSKAQVVLEALGLRSVSA